MVFIGIKTALAREGIKFNADGALEIGIPFIPYAYASATFMHNKEDIHFGVRLNVNSTSYPSLRAICGFCGPQSNFSPGFQPSTASNFNFTWSQERELSQKATTVTAGLSLLPGVRIFGALPLEEAMKAEATNWSVGGQLGLIPYTSLVLAINNRRQIGFGSRLQFFDHGLAVTASLIVEGTTPGDWKYDKNKLAVGFEFG